MVFFKASTGIDDLSWNSGFHLLASWALRLQGVPVAYFACHAGMSHCVLGTNRDDVRQPPPCRSCIHQSKTLYTAVANRSDDFSRQPARADRSDDGSNGFAKHPRGALPQRSEGSSGVSRSSDRSDDFSRRVSRPSTSLTWLTYDLEPSLSAALADLSLADLMRFEWRGIPLGPLCLPGLRWILRIHHLPDGEPTRYLLREYILSAWNVAQKFSAFLDEVQPRMVIVFNGQFYPEAVARWVALKRGIRVVTHEVGLQPASAFFTAGEATAYPIHIPEDFELSAEQNARLDAYLGKRFQGDFTMAGIRFWPQMKGLDPAFLDKAAGFNQIVPIFTNVIFDTSQPHANTVFADMFDWLDMALEVIRRHPETLFVIRAHPDELRLRKASRETVAAWVEASGAAREPNVVFVPPAEGLSSYELIQRSKFVMVYNSTIGLEASIMGAAVLCAGKARFTQYPTVFFPQSVEEVQRTMERFLDAENIDVPAEFRRNARRFLYYQLFRTSLPFGDFLEPSVRVTQARLKSFQLEDLLRSPAVRAITRGVLEGGDFLLED